MNGMVCNKWNENRMVPFIKSENLERFVPLLENPIAHTTDEYKNGVRYGLPIATDL